MNNSDSFRFWVNIFSPRTKKWKKDTLKRLKKEISIFETEEENNIKIHALQFLLN